MGLALRLRFHACGGGINSQSHRCKTEMEGNLLFLLWSCSDDLQTSPQNPLPSKPTLDLSAKTQDLLDLPMDYGTLIEKRKARLIEIEKLMEDPGFFNDQKNSTQFMREHRGLKKLLALWDDYQQVISDIEGNE